MDALPEAGDAEGEEYTFPWNARMADFRKKREWELPESTATRESAYWGRRDFIKVAGLATIGVAGLAYSQLGATSNPMMEEIARLPKLDAPANEKYRVHGDITKESVAARYNNFYEFSRYKDDVWEHARDFQPYPWQLEVGGLVNRPRTYDVDELVRRMPLEERIYRFRCVEAWSMVVPWIGFPLSALLKEVEPTSQAKYVKFTTFFDPEVAPRQQEGNWYSSEPWPYTEGLTIAEAANELTMLSVGIYGHVLPKQHGAPIRLVVPWKYGFKNIKSIVKIELAAKRPETFWNTLAPNEYGFVSNVNPKVPHPRWSQANERVIGTGQRQPTLLYNGYAAQVAHLYAKT